jgi:hypothetical protein
MKTGNGFRSFKKHSGKSVFSGVLFCEAGRRESERRKVRAGAEDAPCGK